jgi:glycerophosphoryl diester phosphodiesterase
MRRPFDLQGHRGARGLFPENTAEAVTAAASLGVSSIELDVVVTADNVPVVFHDLTLNPDIVRTANGSWVEAGLAIANITRAELAVFDVGRLRPGSRTAARFPHQRASDGARIPSLTDICALARRLGIRLDNEIKSSGDRAENLDALAAIVLAAIGDTAGDGTSVRSFDWRVLRAIRAQAPTIPLAWLTAAGPRATVEAVAAEAGEGGWPSWQPVWAPDHHTLRKCDIDQAHAAGLAVKPWTVNAPARMRQLIGWGADGLCTDRPDLAAPLIPSSPTGQN